MKNAPPTRPNFALWLFTAFSMLSSCSKVSILEANRTKLIEGMTFEGQKQTYWCWAASGRAVTTLFGTPREQCEIVSHSKKFACCKESLGRDTNTCNRPGYPDFKYLSLTRPKDSHNDPLPLDFARFKDQIDSNLPVIPIIGWKAGGEHMMVAYGYSTEGSEPVVYYFDPLPVDTGSKWIVPYESLARETATQKPSTFLYSIKRAK
jgi:hypothetical protein